MKRDITIVLSILFALMFFTTVSFAQEAVPAPSAGGSTVTTSAPVKKHKEKKGKAKSKKKNQKQTKKDQTKD